MNIGPDPEKMAAAAARRAARIAARLKMLKERRAAARAGRKQIVDQCKLITFLQRPSCSAETLAKHWNSADEEIQFAVANHPHTQAETLHQLARHSRYTEVLISILNNENTSFCTMRNIKEHHCTLYREWRAGVESAFAEAPQ